MANYKETTTEGTITKWNRARQIVLDNPHNSPPSVMCYETEITKYPDESVQEKNIGSLQYSMTDPTVEIPLIDPETFEPTEQTMKAGEIWLAMASVYLWLARQ